MHESTIGFIREAVKHRQDAGVVRVTFFGQNIEYPEIFRPQPLISNAVSEKFLTGRRFDGFLRFEKIIAELVPRNATDAAVVIAEAGDFVSAVCDFGDQFRHLLSHPAENKKRCCSFVFVEQFERPVSVAFDS
jgi:hypothetical protein